MNEDLTPTEARPGVCQMFLLCTNVAEGTTDHPILKKVPSCQRCADKLEQPLTRY